MPLAHVPREHMRNCCNRLGYNVWNWELFLSLRGVKRRSNLSFWTLEIATAFERPRNDIETSVMPPERVRIVLVDWGC